MEAFNEQYEDYQERLSKTNRCAICDDAINEDKNYCSEKCFRDDNQ
ncbi:hypothetical protein AVT43_gp63 [Polaribacter phage P12002L]|uniref:DUF2116 family Zn-ribbon domain-containing protein n=2 Tax=Incheonvirus TaxID=2976977 RepID=A0A0F7DD32_9CAUD|nr:hypothetical protein AVT42_gp65 [Polaribacter phage P12002S]YP_009209723.1 hypothetical protein AVT43_gp63 [Polaribacter phage P12002L]AKG94237.1 hypothetical protein P12002L_0063 [Polaribacter phage P12002L]AKG94321.1 hypothetical protein P12002S_0065 [Polaribacter phage P12002S]